MFDRTNTSIVQHGLKTTSKNRRSKITKHSYTCLLIKTCSSHIPFHRTIEKYLVQRHNIICTPSVNAGVLYYTYTRALESTHTRRTHACVHDYCADCDIIRVHLCVLRLINYDYVCSSDYRTPPITVVQILFCW